MTELSPDLISAYLDDECTPEERAAVAARLATDPAWAAELDEVRAARDAVRALPLLDVPAGCWDAVAEAIGAADAGTDSVPDGATVVPLRRHRVRNAVFATAATAVASVAAVVALVFITEPPASDRPVRPAVAVLGNVHGARVTSMDEPMTRVATAAIVAPEAGR